ncbi:SRPBCC domain-containing protein [Phenylobacterium sp.]|jgi:uncharacterized protein YndB with AHSA1/START domain|uniref:SRPBCC domain-containing protein n=1 Tax=Phenylobacterium sp. TaxID=1871053 RepID=UPI002F40632D
MTKTTSVSRVIRAAPEDLYAAFLDPAALLAWLPPGRMTGRMHAFEACVGGGYRMSLFYPADEQAFRGKSAEREDRVDVRFVELSPPHRIVQTAVFDTPDPALQGEMWMVTTFEPVPGGAKVAIRHENLPPGLRPEDDQAGSQISLDQLARWIEAP